ncbi:MAG: hypothetical protein LBP74_01230, partial [Treponema sp.]|nr:hypothetical protein [Treponema sp.]
LTAAWQNATEVLVSWDLPTSNEGLSYKLYRGAGTFKNEVTGTIGNVTSYDYETEVKITVTADNYNGASNKVLVIDKPTAPPAGTVWLYRVEVVQNEIVSDPAFAAITLLTKPTAPTITVGAYSADTTKAFITWNVTEDLYDAEFKLEKAPIVKPSASETLTGLGAIEAVGAYIPAKTATGIIAKADYLEGRGVVIDDKDLITRTRWLYRLTVTKDGLSDTSFGILETPAFVSTTAVGITSANTTGSLTPTSTNDPFNYQAAKTIRLTLTNLGSTYWADAPKIELLRRKSTDPEEAFVRIDTDAAPAFTVTSASDTPIWIDSDANLELEKSYIYKIVIKNKDGTIRFTNTSSEYSSPLAPVGSAYFTSFVQYSGSNAVPTNRIRVDVTGGNEYYGDAYLQDLPVKYRIKDLTVATPTWGGWVSATVIKVREGSGTPYTYSYYFDINATSGRNYDIQFYVDTPSATVPGDGDPDTMSNITAN